MVHSCTQCNKNYSSYKSLWYHKYKYHKNNDNHQVDDDNHNDNHQMTVKNEEAKTYSCSKCNKSFEFYQNRWRHEKNCKKEDDKIKNLEDKVLQLEKLIKKADSKINHNNTNNINNGNIINNHNHIQINAIGYEDLIKKLSDTQQLDVLTAGLFDEAPIVELVRKTYNDDSLKENRNTYIPNLQSTRCLTYNNEKKRFDAVNKNKHIQKIIKNRKDDIIKMYAKHGNKIKSAHKKILNEYLDNISKNENINNKFYKEHQEEINLIIYNARKEIKDFVKKIDELESEENEDEDSEAEEIEDEDSEHSVVL